MMSETGPIYGVDLIDSLPIGYKEEGGWRQQLPSRADLIGVKDYRDGQRVVAGYEVLLCHWRAQGDENERLRATVGDIHNDPDTTWQMTVLISEWAHEHCLATSTVDDSDLACRLLAMLSDRLAAAEAAGEKP